jgi:FkbM family methyltransferase
MNLSQRFRMLLRAWKYRLREERESIAFLRRQPLAGKTVIDVGANKGIYSYWLSKQVGPSGRVIAFEPQQDLGPHLEDLKRSFGLRNLRIVNKGLSDRAETVYMTRDKPGATGATVLAAPPSAGADDGEEKIKVDVLPLDEFCQQESIGPIAFIKCDVEGHELPAFRGAAGVIERQRPIILFECHQQDAERGEVFRFLTDRGYEGRFYHGGHVIPHTRFAEYAYRKPGVHHRNYMFAHRDAHVVW